MCDFPTKIISILKNILIISAVFPPEPVVSSQLSLDIATELSKHNEVTVLSPQPTRPEHFVFEEKHIDHPFRHIVVDSFTHPKSQIYGRMKESYSFGKKCAAYIEKNREHIDLVYVNSWPMFSQYFIMKAAKRNHIKTIIHIQDIYPESIVNKLPFARLLFLKILLPMDRYILSNATHVLCISENMKNLLSSQRNVSKEKFSIVSNWQNEENFIKYHAEKNTEKEMKKHSERPFTFMYLGNNGPVAGIEYLIEAFFSAKIPNSRLVIAGSGSKTEDCKNLANRLHAENIEFMAVPDGKVPEVQSIADVLLLPVKTGAAMSSIPSKLPAYMFSKKPIIGSLDLESDTANAIRKAECGIVVRPENKDEFSAALKEISRWQVPQLISAGEKGFNYAIQHFSKQSNLKKVVDLIQA